VGSAVPLLILIVLVGLPPAISAVGVERPEAAPLGSNTSPFDGSAASGTAATAEEALSLTWLRRSINAGRELAFSGTEIVSARHADSSITRVLDLVQGADGVRTATARDSGAQGSQPTESGTGSTADGDGLSGLSERALDALAAGYELRTDGSGRVAGRTATVVVAARAGREVARMWLDNRTGLLLRQDVLNSAGRPQRMAAFLQLTLTKPGSAAGSTTALGPLRAPIRTVGIGGLTVPAIRRSGPPNSAATPTPDPADPWTEVVSPSELTALRANNWPCPVALASGYVMLDARRRTVSGRSTLHLTYGDGLSAISLFLQRGELDATGLTGLTSRKWGDTNVYVRDGWPEVMVWQGGPTVITAVGDTEPADFRAILSALPRQSNHGTLGSLQQRMGSALAWFKN
jgi:sigma-E factor negative regulatory protein RseB